MDSPTLGYVDATHQTLRTHVDETVWTFYWALAEGPRTKPAAAIEKDWTYWKEAILHDLERVHSDIRPVRLAHRHHANGSRDGASQSRRNLFSGAPQSAKARGRILFANSDLSGFSIFEEAQYRGVTAADSVLSQVAGDHGPTH